MHPTKLKLITLFLSAAFSFTACDKENDQTLSASEAKQALTTVDTDLANSLEELSTAKGFTSLQTLSGITGAGDPFPMGRAKDAKKNPGLYVQKGVASLKQMVSHPAQNERTQGDEPFDFNAHKGVYAWNPATGEFQKTAESNIVEIRFPSADSTSNINNAVFRLTAYSEVSTPYGDDLYSPTILEATLDVDGVKEASLSLKVEYRGDGTSEPKFADISFFAKPFTLDVDLDDRNASTTTFSEYLSKDGNKLIGWAITATYRGAKEDQDISKLVGTFQLSSVIFTIEITPPTPTQTEVDYNDFVKISISIDGRPAGNVVWVTDPVTLEPTPYVQYKDGTKQPLSEIFDAIGTALEGLDIG